MLKFHVEYLIPSPQLSLHCSPKINCLTLQSPNMSNNTNICPEDTDSCTLATCSITCAQVEYLPSVPGNAIYLAIFAILLVAQIGLGAWYRTWGFLVGMIGGLVLEIVGYVGRLMLHSNPFDFNAFLTYVPAPGP